MNNNLKKEFNNNLPIYKQIMEDIKLMIVSGKLDMGEKLKSVREFSQIFSVNPNTMQRAFFELEREGLVYSERTSGRYITNDETLIKNLKDKLAYDELKNFIENMKKIGFNRQEIVNKINEFYQKEV